MSVRRAIALLSSAAGLIPIPGIVDGRDTDLPLAVTDAGRVGFFSGAGFGHGLLGTLAPGARRAEAAPVGGFLLERGGVALDEDGTLVAAATIDTGEAPCDPESYKCETCCDRPVVLRRRAPVAAPTVVASSPDRHQNYELGPFALDRAGTAFLLASHANGYDDDRHATAIRVPRSGPAAWRDVPLAEPEPQGYDLRVHDDGTGATALTGDDRPRLHRLTAEAGPWRPTVPAPPRVPSFAPASMLGAGDRAVRVDSRDGVLRLVVEGRPGDLAIGRVAGRKPPRRFGPIRVEAEDVGRDGTVAVLWTRGDAVLLRTVSPRGRRRPIQRLGRIRRGEGDAIALLRVDDRGHAHALFTAPGGRVVAIGPAGRRVLGSGAVALRPAGIATSPRGAEVLAVATAKRWLLTVRHAPR